MLRTASVFALTALFLASCETPHRANRDLHGPADTGPYIERLLSSERVGELSPEVVVERLQLAPDAVVADVGCGPGVFTLPLAEAVPGGLVYGADVEPLQLDVLRERMAAAGIENIVPVLASYGDPHLPPAGVDLIFICDTYHHLENRVAYLRNLSRDLAPGGRLVFLEYKPGDLPVGPPASHKIPRDVRENELTTAGFALVGTIEGVHTYHDFEIWQPRR